MEQTCAIIHIERCLQYLDFAALLLTDRVCRIVLSWQFSQRRLQPILGYGVVAVSIRITRHFETVAPGHGRAVKIEVNFKLCFAFVFAYLPQLKAMYHAQGESGRLQVID